LSGETVTREGPIQNAQPVPANAGPEWDEARAQGCESPRELNLLETIRAHGALPEPSKQSEVWDDGRLLTTADFAILSGDANVRLYIDGLQWHSSGRHRALDNRTTNRLQMMDDLVLRFPGGEVHHDPQARVRQIKRGLVRTPSIGQSGRRPRPTNEPPSTRLSPRGSPISAL
jgi:hypothetical protein